MADSTDKAAGHRKDVHDYAAHHPPAVDVDDSPMENSGGGDDGSTYDRALAKSNKGLEWPLELLASGVEKEYDQIEVPPWSQQLTVRAFIVAVILGIFFSIITHRLSLTVGVIPSLNVAAGLLGFFFVKTWVKTLTKLGFKVRPFTRQENTVIQTCVVSCYGIAFSGGFGSYLLGMSAFAYNKVGPNTPGNSINDVKNPKLSWIFPYIFIVSLLGIFVLVPLRKIMIIDYKLTYPSGTATAVLINSFHTPSGARVAKRQVRCLGKYLAISTLWSFFKWFFSGVGYSCGFDTFPSLGLKAYANKFYFDFNLTYVGAGMICPHIVNVSVIFGGIVSWGIMWPLISNNKGKWFPVDAEGSDFKGLFGYKVFISIALILGDGLYTFVKVTVVTMRALYVQYKLLQQLPTTLPGENAEDLLSYDEKRRNEVFMKDGVPYWLALVGYSTLAIISIISVPHIFPSVKWYYVFVAYIIAPVLAFCNAYGCGLTDWSLASNYGKLLLFIFATWAGPATGPNGGGILAGLAACGVMMSIVSTGSDLMQDFKTGYLTLSSPRSMFISQLIGGIMGCVIAPSTFWLFWKAFKIGSPGSIYQAPYAVIYRSMALIGVEGFGALPKHCVQLCAAWFAFAVVVCFIRDRLPKKYSQYVPLPMAMAIPFYIGPYFAVDMFVGTVLRFMWEMVDRKSSDSLSPAAASGLICGDGLWTIPTAILNFAKVDPPICMTFFPGKQAAALNYPLY